MNASRLSAFAVPAVALVALTGCTASAPTVDETFVPGPDASSEPAPMLTPNPVEPDTTLIVRATATAANGAQLSLELQAHRSVAWDDIAAQTLPQALLDDCAAQFTADMFAAEQWSFTRVNLTAIPTAESTDTWPVTSLIEVEPGARVAIAGRGDLLAAGDAATPLCERDRYLTGAGKGGIAVGIPGDGTAFTAWATQAFGFRVPDATLSGCSIEVTALGATVGGGAGDWVTLSDDTTCAAGSATALG